MTSSHAVIRLFRPWKVITRHCIYFSCPRRLSSSFVPTRIYDFRYTYQHIHENDAVRFRKSATGGRSSLVPKPLRQILWLPKRDSNLIQISNAIVAARAENFDRSNVNVPYWLAGVTSESSLSYISCGDVECLQRHVYALRPSLIPLLSQRSKC